MLQITAFMLLIVTSFAFPTPNPNPNDNGLLNTNCQIQDPTLEDMKKITCIIEEDVLSLLQDSTIQSLDPNHGKNINNFHSVVDEVEACNCDPIILEPSYLEFFHQPKYNVAPHLFVPKIYHNDDDDNSFPDNLRDEHGELVNITTEWIIKDQINSIEAFLEYFTPTSNTPEGLKIAEVVRLLNESIIPNLKFQFTPECPSDPRMADFSGLTNQTCESKCSMWYFNVSVNGLYNALANHEIYTPSHDFTAKRSEWFNLECCNLLEDVYTITSEDYRKLTCSTGVLIYESYNLFKELDTMAVTECAGVSTVTGINTWMDYFEINIFPWSHEENLYIYANHFDALQKHSTDLSALLTADPQQMMDCLSDVTDKISTIENILSYTILEGKNWMKAHGCPKCSDSCIPPPNIAPESTPITTNAVCSDMHKQVSCLALNLRNVTESLYLYLNLRDEAVDTWKYPCAPWPLA